MIACFDEYLTLRSFGLLQGVAEYDRERDHDGQKQKPCGPLRPACARRQGKNGWDEHRQNRHVFLEEERRIAGFQKIEINDKRQNQCNENGPVKVWALPPEEIFQVNPIMFLGRPGTGKNTKKIKRYA